MWAKFLCWGFNVHRAGERAVSSNIFGFRYECGCGKYYWFEDKGGVTRKFRVGKDKGRGR